MYAMRIKRLTRNTLRGFKLCALAKALMRGNTMPVNLDISQALILLMDATRQHVAHIRAGTDRLDGLADMYEQAIKLVEEDLFE
jgi:hypothetical protein